MTSFTEALWGDDPVVLEGIRAAGWFEGRCLDVSGWTLEFQEAGFEVNDRAAQIWKEFGELRIGGRADREPPSSLLVDPVDACIDRVDEAARLRQRFGRNYTPLGWWSAQFRSYIGADGHVVAVSLRTLWHLGFSFPEALVYVVCGDGLGSRAERADWLG